MSLKISVVTPNYNCVDCLEQTILSVISQGYPNLEYIIVDGASTDGSLEIIERYRHHFAHVVSEPDNGHADALNKGFSLATGDVLCWINSDDLLIPGSLQVVDQVFSSFHEVEWITGIPSVADEFGSIQRHPLRIWSWQRFLCGDFRHIQQESTFWRRRLWDESGGQLNLTLNLANDFDLWLRYFRRAKLYTVVAELGCFRRRQGQRSISLAEDYEKECSIAFASFINEIPITHLADHFSLVPDDQLKSRRKKPKVLPPQLTIFDPPLITMNSATGLPEMLNRNDASVPSERQIEVESLEDLVFDGTNRVLWRGGPDFSKGAVDAIEIILVPFTPSAVVVEPLSELSPPMPCVVGPMSISDWGRGKHTIQIRFAEGAASHDLHLPEVGKSYRIKLLLEKLRYTLILDGHVLASGKTSGKQIMQGPVAIIGGGHAQRYWLGAIEKVVVVLRHEDKLFPSSPRTYQLTHIDGKFSLPREFRSAFAKPQLLSTKLREQSSPLSAWRNKHKGQRCFVMGNGPSLNKMDLNLLAGETVFACNAVFLLYDRVEWRPTYYVCVDTRVIRDRAADITSMLDRHPEITGFFPTILHLHDGSGHEFEGRGIIRPGLNRHYFNEVGNRQSHHVETMFSLDADDYVVQPYTVAITMLQLAIYMGFKEIYLIGCDTSYKVKATVEQAGRQIDGVGLCLTSTKDDDENHFDPRYFGQGREWHNPQVSKMLEHYRWARLAARQVGARIRNATVGGELEVFERIDFNTLFPAPIHQERISIPPCRPILSIAIPAYGRPGPLLKALKSFAAQIDGRFEGKVEIVISDDCTPDDGLREVRAFAGTRGYMRWRSYKKNIGLERNLIACTDICTGEYLWIFGDDDFLETDDALETILEELHQEKYDVLVLNRTRRSTDLQTLISPNWMGLDASLNKPYSGLREFCLDFGFISVLGFISVNIFRRRQFQLVDNSRYIGTMYPHLGAMLEAFHSRSVLLIGAPLVCHRTQSPEEKRQALGKKVGEADFMADSRRRNAIYFSHPYIAMLDDLVSAGAFGYDDIPKIPENTVINGLLVDFLIDCVKLNDELRVSGNLSQWRRTANFMRLLPLDALQRAKVEPILKKHVPDFFWATDTKAHLRRPLTISVVTPSYNQAEFLSECLTSVKEQSYPAIEHLVFDPGSKDGSREIASSFPHVTLFAEADTGQSDALNKGFLRAKGDIIAWLNSDDMLADSHVFQKVVDRFSEQDSPDVVYGKGIYVDEHGKKLRDAYINKDPDSLNWRFHQEDGIMQPALFMRRSVIGRVGLLRADLHFSMDYEYWIRCVKAGVRFAFLDRDLAIARYHLSNKTYGQRGSSYSEVCEMTKRNFGYVSPIWLRRYAEFLSDGHDGVLAHGGNAVIRDKNKLEEAYRALMLEYNGDPQALAVLRDNRLKRGYAEAFEEVKKLGLISDVGTSLSTSDALVGPFNRSKAAHWDESHCIAQLYGSVLSGKVMIDVGAHHGFAHAPFLDNAWQIFAFEPDENNRAKLLERLSKHKYKHLVWLDTRCVSNKSKEGVSFFTSEQSTGISGLSAFHETHKESQKVDITTLADFFQDRPMPAIDFLKIDTEGHDLFVLQGYPWERGGPAVIECEFEDTKTVPLGYTFHELARYLMDKGYQIYVSEWHPIIRYGIRHNWRALTRYPCELADPKGWGNLLAFRDPIDEQALLDAVKKVLHLGTPASAQAPASAPVAIGPSILRVEPGQHYAPIGPNQWLYTHSEAKQRLWLAILAQPVDSGQALTGGLHIQSDRAMTVNITLGRHGSTPYEGATQRLQLVPGQAHVVTLTKTFDKPHAALKLQVEVVALPDGSSATLIITELHLAETPESICQRLGVITITLAEANRRLRAGDFATALPMYLWLHDQCPMRIYADNALFAARKLGLTQTTSTDELHS